MRLAEIIDTARELVLEWHETTDCAGWAEYAILNVLAPLCEGDPDVEEVVRRIENEYGDEDE